MNKIILATHNKGKLAEMLSPFADLGYLVENLDGYNLEAPEENGNTFEENALIKARYVSEKTGHIALADDSGLEVYALDNRPSIYSARYAQMQNSHEIITQNISDDTKNILQVLKEMEDIKDIEKRKARFVSCLSLVFPDNRAPIIAHGFWEGQITFEPKGENGFGYDPIFFDPKLNKVSAELAKSEKMAISHRAKAIENLLAQMPRLV